jgi:hypothetical protein
LRVHAGNHVAHRSGGRDAGGHLCQCGLVRDTTLHNREQVGCAKVASRWKPTDRQAGHCDTPLSMQANGRPVLLENVPQVLLEQQVNAAHVARPALGLAAQGERDRRPAAKRRPAIGINHRRRFAGEDAAGELVGRPATEARGLEQVRGLAAVGPLRLPHVGEQARWSVRLVFRALPARDEHRLRPPRHLVPHDSYGTAGIVPENPQIRAVGPARNDIDDPAARV